MKKKILILGSNGTLGKCLLLNLKKNKKYNIFGTSKKKSDFNLNLKNFSKLQKLILKLNFDIIINCAAYTNLSFCENNYEKIKIINTSLPTKLSLWSSIYNFKYIHISTDHIYLSKKNIANKENSKTGWHNKYSKSKFLAEKKFKNKKKTFDNKNKFYG